tara:strand:- start:302 stop:571 length:270 start_codon:yes stop_codon:yes gene_type:complete
MKWQWFKELIILHLVCISILMLMFSIVSCTYSTPVGHQVTPDTTVSDIFSSVIDTDSIEHWYGNQIYSNSLNYCYYHEQYEHVRKTTRK